MLSLQGVGGRLAWQAAMCCAAFLFGLGALGTGLAALYHALRPVLVPAEALGVVTIVLILLALGAVMLSKKSRPTGSAGVSPASMPEFSAILPEVARGLRKTVAADPSAAVLGALAAGFISESRSGSDLVSLARILGLSTPDRTESRPSDTG